jgi:pimeloyl-ACP methyl ester carboxylesterase
MGCADRARPRRRRRAPLLVLWGDKDNFTPADGPVGRWFQGLPARRADTVFTFLPGAGHCPMDEVPEAVHVQLLPWLAKHHA